MAITIITEPQGALLNTYNNSIIEFTTDVGVGARATILAEGLTFEITPNMGVFYFNLKEVVSVINNPDNFRDSIVVTTPSAFVFPDPDLYNELDFTITIYKTDGTFETLVKTYNYKKGVLQLVRSKFDVSDVIRILSPSTDNVSNITYFEGHPFDFSIYSNAARTVTITNKRTTGTLDITLSKGVNRVFLSNGENDNLGFEGQLPLYIGVNELELVGGGVTLTAFIKKVAVSCGVLLKWFNQNGAWSYWRFSPVYKDEIKTKSYKSLNNDFKNIESANNRVSQTGKTAERYLNLTTDYMSENERFIVAQIFSSPKVFYYNNSELQPFELLDWIEIDTGEVSEEIKNTIDILDEFEVKIELPNLYTQTYAG